MFIRNCWYVAGWSSEVKFDQFFTRTLLNIPVVMWRKSDGEVIAFRDMCCHRGAPLSVGRREGDCVRCMYHGLKFDEYGTCIEIPGQDRIPPNLKVQRYPIVERNKWLWIWMGDAALADPDLIEDTHWLDDPEWASLEGYTYYPNTNYMLILDNLLDLAHLPYVHPNTLGGGEDFAAKLPKVEMIDNGVKITRWTMNTTPPEFVQKVKPYAGKVDRWNIQYIVLPSIFTMDSGMAVVDTGAELGNRVDAVEFRSCQALTPETDKSTHYFFSQPHNFLIDRPEVTASIHESVIEAFKEDYAIIQAQCNNLDKQADFVMLPIQADAALGKFRWLTNQRLKSELNPNPTDTVTIRSN